MAPQSFEVRVCKSCGLRYPLMKGHSFGDRCPHCLGETRVVLKKTISIESTSTPGKKKNNLKLSVLIDNVRSAWNVGSILRTADGLGFTHAYLCGITPTPDQDAVQKTALGAEEYVTWSHHKDATRLVKGLKKEGWQVIAIEEDARAVEIHKATKPSRDTVVIMGSEVTGVDPELLDLADHIYYIPMYGGKRSFNVAVAFGVAAWALPTGG
jgi:23S rRNA (guanosine2251-2'-O)-methyltransferase